jgi:hypothetical protein
MLRATLSKAMWVGRGAAAVFGLALVLALVMGVATMALAAVPGDPFRLGQTNGIDQMSTLVGNAAGTMLRVENNSTAAGATALDLRVETGKAPMKVNSATRVANLNADRVDGKHATDFYAAGSKVVDSSHADTADQADSATSAGDANTLDGKDSTQFADSSHTHSGADITSGTVEADRIEDGQGSGLNADQLDGLNSTQLPHGFYQVLEVFTLASPANGFTGGEAFCDAGDQVVGGGYTDLHPTSHIATDGPSSGSSGTQSGWVITWKTADPNTTDTVGVYALCADFGDTHN